MFSPGGCWRKKSFEFKKPKEICLNIIIGRDNWEYWSIYSQC